LKSVTHPVIETWDNPAADSDYGGFIPVAVLRKGYNGGYHCEKQENCNRKSGAIYKM